MSAVLKIGGVTIDRVATRTTLLTCRPFAKDGYPTLAFARAIGSLTPGPDPWDGQLVTLIQDGILIFAGDAGSHLTHYDTRLGWVREWTCYGLAKRAEYIPVTDAVTTSDTIRYNLSPDNPDDIPARDGRTVGQIVADVLTMSANQAALDAAGIGNYTSSGTGATAQATITSGSVTGVTIDQGGNGYTSPPTVIFSGGGGSGATGTATVSGGAVTGVSIGSAGSGYLTAPVVILSTLPTITLDDLDGLTVIPPFEVDVVGERILQALEGMVQTCHPNHFLQIDPNGNIRFLDPRTFPADIALTMDGSDPRVGRPSITSDWSSCYSRCVVRGNDLVVAVTLGVQPWPGSTAADGGLAEDFAHDGLTNSQAKTQYRATDFTSPIQSPGTATATATLSGSTVGSIAVVISGYGYTAAPTVSITGGGGSGATATASISGGGVSSITMGSHGSSYTSAPTVTLTGPAVGQSDVGTCSCPNTTNVVVTSTNMHAAWIADYWDQTETGHHGVIVLRSDAISDFTQLFSARVVANTSLAAGGSSTLTLDTPMPATSYNSYQLFGTSGGASLVYRQYKVTNADIASRLANYFPYPVAYRNSDGTAATLTSTPVGTVFYSSTGMQPYQQSGIGISVDPTSGTVLTARPTCLVFSPDGSTIVPVDDFQAFLPVHSGELYVVEPADVLSVPQYTGTMYSELGIERTKTITVPDWRDNSNSANMLLMAQEFLDSVKDIVYEGTITYFGLLSSALLAGHALNVDGNGYSTGWEALNVPIVAVDLQYCERGGATSYVTTLTFSNRRAPYSGAAFQRPAMVGQPFGGEGFGGGVGDALETMFGVASQAGAVAQLAAGPSAADRAADVSATQGTGDLGRYGAIVPGGFGGSFGADFGGGQEGGFNAD
jgi:hypothetical protein